MYMKVNVARRIAAIVFLPILIAIVFWYWRTDHSVGAFCEQVNEISIGLWVMILSIAGLLALDKQRHRTLELESLDVLENRDVPKEMIARLGKERRDSILVERKQADLQVYAITVLAGWLGVLAGVLRIALHLIKLFA